MHESRRPRNTSRIHRAATRLALAAVLCVVSSVASGQQATLNVCGSLENAYGPYDYRTERNGHLRIVERSHFTPQVEALLRGVSGTIGAELDYVLRASPNHHRALVAVERYAEKLKTPQPADLRYPVDCYFDRAVRFAPDDVIVRMLYAQYLGKQGRPDDALRELTVAESLAKDDPFAHYNIGLVYLELKQFDRAVAEAHKAKALGFERHDLEDALKRAGKWSEPQ